MARTDEPTPDAQEWRGGLIEGRHPWSAVRVADAGEVRGLGEALTTTWRSAAKPFQLAVSLAQLGGPRAFSPPELAVGAASHSAEPRHLALVDALMQRLSVPVEALRCGAHAPIHEPSCHALLRRGQVLDARHNNCSGKHTFMAGATAAAGWPGDYRPADHPLQRAMIAAVTRWAGEVPTLAVDGCGVPTFGLSLTAMARAWQVMATRMATGPQAGDDPATASLSRIGWAMADRGDLVSGTGRLDAAVLAYATEPMAVKIGARGVFCIALPRRRAGLAVKVHSGSMEALSVAVPAALDALAPGAFLRPGRWEPGVVRNVVGAVVGRWRLATGVSAGPGG